MNVRDYYGICAVLPMTTETVSPTTINPDVAVEEEVDIVDENNAVVRHCSRKEMRKHNLLHRSTYIIVFNSEGKIYVQRRAFVKDYCPGYLDPAPGGVLQAGESYEENALRELGEEMGIHDLPLRNLGTFFHSGIVHVWGCLFVGGPYDGPLKLQSEEVHSCEVMRAEDVLRADITHKDKVVPDGIQALKLYLNFTQQPQSHQMQSQQ
eukprot:c6378_g1_i1.p1 GENE.c6378_g1_i1~~c6378_g1_i1.p1  ORF type:complete len:208 (-),score=46.35 c6378_g1_i1:950-1573(-)